MPDIKWYTPDATSRPNYALVQQHCGYFRMAALGTRVSGDARPFSKGNLNAAPIGLGYLPATGYLGDLRSLFCPSVGGGMRVLQVTGSSGNYTIAFNEAGVVDSPQEVQALGGFEASSLTHGDYNAATKGANFFARSIGTNNCGMLSHYGYRNAPMAPAAGNPPPAGTPFFIPGIRPKMSFTGRHYTPDWAIQYIDPAMPVGQPLFKTGKTLGGRAIVSDAFDRRPQSATDTAPGLGYDAHREGYTVLYGDWSARWYGDPQKRIMYSSTTYNAWAWSPAWPDIEHLDSDAIDLTGGLNYHIGVTVWHEFDVASGVDAGVSIPDN